MPSHRSLSAMFIFRASREQPRGQMQMWTAWLSETHSEVFNHSYSPPNSIFRRQFSAFMPSALFQTLFQWYSTASHLLDLLPGFAALSDYHYYSADEPSSSRTLAILRGDASALLSDTNLYLLQRSGSDSARNRTSTGRAHGWFLSVCRVQFSSHLRYLSHFDYRGNEELIGFTLINLERRGGEKTASLCFASSDIDRLDASRTLRSIRTDSIRSTNESLMNIWPLFLPLRLVFCIGFLFYQCNPRLD